MMKGLPWWQFFLSLISFETHREWSISVNGFTLIKRLIKSGMKKLDDVFWTNVYIHLMFTCIFPFISVEVLLNSCIIKTVNLKLKLNLKFTNIKLY